MRSGSQVAGWLSTTSWNQRSRGACMSTAPPVWRTTSTVSTVLVPGSFSAASTLAFSGIFRPPRRPSSAVMISLLWQSLTRSAIEFGAKPPNTTEWIAPMRAQASMATAASTIIGR
ncbi:hypothetical protein G6F61_014621 [Rhizopus arrhizus]|nr:hypothetical protein G6F61_014621 [Rhizopus arrhizus]